MEYIVAIQFKSFKLNKEGMYKWEHKSIIKLNF